MLLAAALAACTDANEPSPAPPRPRGIVLLLLDTVRVDRLSVHDPARATTPALAALAARGAVFEAVQSPAPWTVPALASLWTGLAPTVHRAGLEGEEARSFDPLAIHGFDAGLATLPGRLAALGYRTHARIANELLGMECFTAGFDEAEVGRASADELVTWVEERLPELQREPFFLYLHFMDAHVPLAPADELVQRFLPAGFAREALPPAHRDARYWGKFKKAAQLGPHFADFRVLKEATYDAALRQLDAGIARLLGLLERADLLADTLVVVTADHGEELWDHWALEGEAYAADTKLALGTGHGHTLFQELLRVPLIVAGPGVSAGQRIGTRLQLADLGATVLELAGAGRAPELGDGASFAALLRGEALAERSLYSEGLAYGYELRALVDPSGFKLIRATHPGERELLFDLASDPGETRDLLAEEPERAAVLRRALDAHAAELARRRHPRGERLQAADLGELEDLGYVEAGEQDVRDE